jgi:hypothetical protein
LRDRRPSDAVLEDIVDILPSSTWKEVAKAMGKPIETKPEESDVRREEIVESLKCWKAGLSDKPITWEFLLGIIRGLQSLQPDEQRKKIIEETKRKITVFEKELWRDLDDLDSDPAQQDFWQGAPGKS